MTTTITNNYGVGYFQIYTDVAIPVKILDGQGLDYELDLSDRETVEVENIALDGTRYNVIKGQYVNPKIKILYPQSDIQTALISALGDIIQFTPYNDNSAFMNRCRLVNFTPIFDENSAILISIEIELKSVNYWVWTPLIITT